MNIMREYMILPPPNVTGELHCGHFLMTCILDSITRINNIIMNKTTYICPGTDHGGIAMQVSAQKYYAQKFNRPPTEQEIYDLSEIYKHNIENSLKNWNISFDWSKNHYTLNESHSRFVSEMFCKLYNHGYIYSKKTLINWDTGFKTAISDLEVDSINTKDKLYYIKYNTSIGEDIIISTTRPETMFADVAIMINPNDKDKLKYIGAKAYIPFINKEIPILSDEYVSMEFGTGVLKVTPGHDHNDYKLAIKYNLPILNIFNENNEIILDELNLKDMTEISKIFTYGHNIYNVRKSIVEILACDSIDITHNVPISSRSGERVETCIQEQWFMDMSEAAQLALSANITYLPTECFKNNMNNWLNNIQDWCLSRSLPWGHTMPIWHGVNGDIIVSIDCPGPLYTQTKFKLDTWFSSALWPLSYKNTFNIFPFNTLVTGYDILFFWVARMIMVTLIIRKIDNPNEFIIDDHLPFNKVYLHGLVRDAKGLKMSKTLNNVKNPNNEIIKLQEKYSNHNGYDILRLSLLLQVSPNNNVKMIEDPIRARNIMTKIHNLSTFVLNNNIQESIHNNSELGLYFCGKLQQFYNSIHKMAQATSLHLIIDKFIEFLYDTCDYLVEFYKVDKNLGYILKQSFHMLNNIYSIICPNTAENIAKAHNMNICDIVNPEYISIESEHYLITIIKQLRSFHNNLKIMYYYDGHYKEIVHKLCANKCEYNDNLHKIMIANQVIYLYIPDIKNLQQYIVKKQKEISNIIVNEFIPQDIKEEKLKIINMMKEELKSLGDISHA